MMDEIKAMFARMDDKLQRYSETINRGYDQMIQIVLDSQERMDALFIKFNSDSSLMTKQSAQEQSVQERPQTEQEQPFQEQILSNINSTSTITEDIALPVLAKINSTSRPPMQVKYDFVLPSSITKIKSDYDVVLGEIYSDPYAIKPVLTPMLATPKFAAPKFAVNEQRTSKILVFDPGGIRYINGEDQDMHCYMPMF